MRTRTLRGFALPCRARMTAVPGASARLETKDTVDADWREVQAQIDAVVHELDRPVERDEGESADG